MSRWTHRQSAFTLVEILSVIIIMGIISALLIMAAKGARRKADTDGARAGVMFIDAKIHAYVAKRGQLPPDLDADGITTEVEIYSTLAEWDFAVPPERQVDPWGNPYIVILQRDYLPVSKPFPIDGAPPYDVQPWNKLESMYRPLIAGPSPKEIHEGDPLITGPYMNETDSFQIISAGPDGLLSRDDGERTADPDGDGESVNADNLTNW